MYHRRGERFTDQYVYVSDRFVMVWAGICHDGRTLFFLYVKHIEHQTLVSFLLVD